MCAVLFWTEQISFPKKTGGGTIHLSRPGSTVITVRRMLYKDICPSCWLLLFFLFIILSSVWQPMPLFAPRQEQSATVHCELLRTHPTNCQLLFFLELVVVFLALSTWVARWVASSWTQVASLILCTSHDCPTLHKSRCSSFVRGMFSSEANSGGYFPLNTV